MCHGVVTELDLFGKGEVDAVAGAIDGKVSGDAIHLAGLKRLRVAGEPSVGEHQHGAAGSADFVFPIESAGIAIDHTQAHRE